MNRILFLCVVLMGVSFSGILKAETVLYCNSELTVGFIKDGGSWRKGNFENDRFTVKLNSEYTQLNFSQDDTYTCSWAWNNKNFGIVNCTSTYNNGKHFNYNINKKRFLFLQTSSTGYLENAEIPDTNVMMAGSCKNF